MEQPPSDRYLLKRYAFDRSQAAFSRLVDRHFRLVYATCYRELNQHELAEEAAQSVFLELARSSRAIRSEAAVASWLYTTARHKAAHLRRQEQRHMARAQRAAEEVTRRYDRTEDEAWASIEPGLNDALSALSVPDQQAILLRFFDQMSLRDVGLAMGTNEDTAQKRVARALEKLRVTLVNRKAATVSAGILAALLTERATSSVPAHLSALVAQSSAGALSTPSASAVSQLFRPLNPLIGKGLLIVSTTKIAAGAVGVVILLAVVTVGVHKLRSPAPGPESFPVAGAPQGTFRANPLNPVAQSGTDPAANAVDAGRIHDLAAAMAAYEQKTGRYPDADRWHDEIMPYIKPNNPGVQPDQEFMRGSSWAYAYNSALSGVAGKDIHNPQSIAILFDSTANKENAADTGQSMPNPGWFQGGVNMGFVDGHVQRLSNQEAQTAISKPL